MGFFAILIEQRSHNSERFRDTHKNTARGSPVPSSLMLGLQEPLSAGNFALGYYYAIVVY